MRRFVFRFQAVLDARSLALDEATRVLAGANRKRAFAVELLTERRHALAGVLDHGVRSGGGFDAHHALIRQRYAARLREEIHRREQQLVLIDREVHAAREAVTAAHREKRAMELLLERDLEAWREEARREENALIDETNTQRHARR